jgi:ATP-dependent DNA helicase HFM1/MER3
MQSEVFDAAACSDQALAVAAPTGSGKTVVFELAVCRLLSSQLDSAARFVHRPGAQKVVYVAPMRVRSLCEPRQRDSRGA